MFKKFPTIEEIYNYYHGQTFFVMKGFYPKPVKNFDTLVNDNDKELLRRFQSFLKRNIDMIDWKLYIKSLAQYFKRRFELKILGSLAGNKIYRQYLMFNNLNSDKSEEDVYQEIINSLNFLKNYLKENEITFDEYFNLDVSTVPIYLKHIYGGIISQYFYACFPHSKLVRMFFNTPDDCFLEFFNLSKNEFIDLNIMNKRDNILKYQSIKTISDKFQEKFGK